MKTTLCQLMLNADDLECARRVLPPTVLAYGRQVSVRLDL